MKAYVVGGAVRDALLGRASADRDWVVVGATPEQMAAAGFIPVGRDFPVFLHPQTKEEYALARTERKTAPGYRGFAFHADPAVTLEQDLARRDLTINAMAMHDDGTVIDPHGGRRDLANRVLRHVSPAFSEDPVRILRLARFAARYPAFRVAPQTLTLARAMVDAGEVDALVPERVWAELARGLMEPRPSRMLQVLRDCTALARLLPELDRLWAPAPGGNAGCAGEHVMRSIDLAAAANAELPVRFACLVHHVDPAGPARQADDASRVLLPVLEHVCSRLRVPAECHGLADTVARESAAVHACVQADAPALLALLERCDALRRPQRLGAIVQACEVDALALAGAAQGAYPPREQLTRALRCALGVDTARVAARAQAGGAAGPAVGAAIHAARLQAIDADLNHAAR